MRKLFIAAGLFMLTGCTKSGSEPQVFLPHVVGQNGEDLDAVRLKVCDPSKVDLTNNVLTQQNFQAMFACANYDHTLNGLEPLFDSAHLPKLISSVNAITQSPNSHGIHKDLKDQLGDWLKDGPDGTSRADRLLPFLASLIENPSFQDFLPVLSTILQSGKSVWADLLPGLADVVYTDLFPDNLEDAFVIFNTLSSDNGGKGKGTRNKDDGKDYAKSVKQFARFLEMDVDGKKASTQALELADGIRDLVPEGTSFYQLVYRLKIRNAINQYLLNSSTMRGEKVDPKLNESPDDATVACPDLNDTPEHREECAYRRMWQRPSDGGDAPITELAGLVVELSREHPDMLPALAAWFSANGDRVSHGLGDYVTRAQVVTNLSKLNVANYLQQWATKNNIDVNEKIDNAKLAEYLGKAFADADFAPWVNGILPSINKEAFGEKNASYLVSSTLPADIASLYASPEIAAFAKAIIPDGQTATGVSAFRKFNNKHRTDALQVTFRDKKQSVEKHLGDIWIAVVKTNLGEDVVLNYVIKLAQTLFTQMANDFRDKGQTLSQWLFYAPNSNPETLEMVTGYAIKELDLLTKYNQNKDWLMNDFTNEVFTNENDKRAFRLLLDQVPNIVIYVRSGMARSGADLTRALSNDESKYLVNSYIDLISKAYNTGWLRKGVRLLEAYHATPDYKRASRMAPNDSDPDIDKYQLGVNALERIVESLVKPGEDGDYQKTTLARLTVPLSSIVGDGRRGEADRFLQTSADQLLGLTDKQINDFFHKLHDAKPPGEADQRRANYRAVSDVMKNPNCPDLVTNVSGLFQDQAVKPALDFLAQRIDDGTLPRLLRLIRRLLGFGN